MRLPAPLLAGLAAAALAAAPGLAVAKTSVSIGMQQEPTVLDPTADATASIDSMLTANVFESLTTVNESGEVLPALAESWEVSDDGLTYTFTLVEDAVFHDGAAFDSSDVKFSFDRAMAEDSVNPSKDVFAPIASVEAPDARTVVITLSRPDAFLLFNLSQGDASIVDPSDVETNATDPVGTGPYRFASWTRGDRLVLEAVEDHRDAEPGMMQRITFRFIGEAPAAVAALLAEEIDAFPGMPAPETLEQFKADPRFDVVVGTTEGEIILAMNNARPPFDDVRVRRAISHALDRPAIVEGAYYGYGEPIGSFFPPHHAAYVDLTGMYPHDPEKARALLAEAGVEDLEVTMRLPHFPYARRSGEIIQQQLAEAGIDAKIENVEWGFWISEVYKNLNYDMTIIAHTSPNDMGNFARGPEYFYGYDDPEFTALWDEIRTEPNPERLAELLQQGQRHLAEQAVHGFLFQLPKLGVYRSGLSGYWASSPVLFAPLKDLRWEG
ncbi:MAG: ABC transporter substrate-binding protein [Paracoccaceae bacterium]